MPSRMQAIDGRSAARPRNRAARGRQGRRDACGPAPSDVSPCCCRPVRQRRRRARLPMTPVVAGSPRRLQSQAPRCAGSVRRDRAARLVRAVDAAAARPDGVATAIRRSRGARLRGAPHGRGRVLVCAAARMTTPVDRLAGTSLIAGDAPAIPSGRSAVRTGGASTDRDVPAVRSPGCPPQRGRALRGPAGHQVSGGAPVVRSRRIPRVQAHDLARRPPSAPMACGRWVADRGSCASRTGGGTDSHGWWR
jgi:hypothetical protein